MKTKWTRAALIQHLWPCLFPLHPPPKENKQRKNQWKKVLSNVLWLKWRSHSKVQSVWPKKKKKKQPKTWHKIVTAQPFNNNIVHMVLSTFLIKLDFTGFFVFVFSQHFLQPSNLEVSSLMFSVLWNSSDFLTFWVYSSFASSKNSHFQNEAKYKSFLVKMIFIYMKIKTHFF